MNQAAKILIVDDSRVFRTILERTIATVPDVQIAGKAESGIQAIEFLRNNQVDLMTLDVEMPGLNGLETLKKMFEIKSQLKSVPDVIMVSSLTRTGSDITIKAMELGAFDFISKPSENVPNVQESLSRMLQNAINTWRFRKNKSSIRATTQMPAIDRSKTGNAALLRAANLHAGFTYTLAKPFPHVKPVMAIIIGVSTGGPKSLADMLPKLCSMTDLPILLVQHMPPNFTKSLAESLDTKCKHTVVEGTPGTVVEANHVYIAPGGYHMVVRSRGASFVLENNQDPPENGCRPSVDVLFRSAAAAYPSDSLAAVILTGMGSDGTLSLQQLKPKNAYLIAQDEETSVVYGMPRAAAATGLLDKVAPLMRIPEAVIDRINMGKK